MQKKKPRYRTPNLLPNKYEELEATAAELTAEEGAQVTVPQLIYRMHKQFVDQRKGEVIHVKTPQGDSKI